MGWKNPSHPFLFPNPVDSNTEGTEGFNTEGTETPGKPGARRARRAWAMPAWPRRDILALSRLAHET